MSCGDVRDGVRDGCVNGNGESDMQSGMENGDCEMELQNGIANPKW